jgi:two-component system alkaline phosphatase synthesis response regulator PhoP
MRILLAEDDPHISVITQLCLEKIGGHSVVLRQDGEAALQTALLESFDLILLDGMMPKKSGLQVAIELKELKELKGLQTPSIKSAVDTPIIFLSAKTDSKDIDQFTQLGAGYIAKPFDPQTICARIDTILLAAGANR